MGNVLDNIRKDNTRFTVFENDQVLTADHLNDLFNFLDVQSRLTRTQVIGVGIICGLEIGLLDNRHIAVSKGAAITTDGDILQFFADQEFDQYETFDDRNAKYPYFLLDTNQPLVMFELLNSQLPDSIPGKDLATFEESTSSLFKDYVGVLYLEDYNNDPDLCTGTDCDNKGIIAVKNLKVVLIHKNSVSNLLQSMPAMNKDYFALDDLSIPRVNVSTTIDTYAELNGSFNAALAVKDDIKAKLLKAYQTCKLIVDEDFDTDPTTEWSTLLDQHFSGGTTLSTQYVYDFARDLSYAYSELKESLFSEDMLCCPPVGLFPKHVLMGLVRDAQVKPPVSPFPGFPFSPPIVFPTTVVTPFDSLINFRFPTVSALRFNFGSLLKRFNPIHIDLEYRHHFYESPILASNDDSDRLTRFCFMRIHSMITNFKVPSSEEIQNIETGLKITPGYFEDAPLGERSIPFYYRYNADLPLNLYWNFKANSRKKENQILSYSSFQYATSPAALTPLKFNILPFTFFRVEGHIGFRLPNVETALNKLILENNLPINVQAVQVEKRLETIPTKPWFFPHLYLYEKSLKTNFMDKLDNADLVNDELQLKDPSIPVSEFKTAKQNVIDNDLDIGNPQFNFISYRSAISNVMTAATNVKAQTKQYTFSNAATPHDFILNSDIIRKTDVIASIYQESLNKKKTGLMLGNFMKGNPGLEHAGGVLRGGTFVLVYTADDQKVVADFMLPYASIDKEVVPDPPVYKPLPLPLPPQTPIVPKFPIGPIFEVVPNYKKHFDENIVNYPKEVEIDDKLTSKVNIKFSEVETRFDLKLAVTNTKIDGMSPQIASFDQRLKDNSNLFNTVLNRDIRANIPSREFEFRGVDLTEDVRIFRAKHQELLDLAPDAPGRNEKEAELLNTANVLTERLNNPNIVNDPANATAVKSVLADVFSGTSLVQNAELKNQASSLSERANIINRGLRRG